MLSIITMEDCKGEGRLVAQGEHRALNEGLGRGVRLVARDACNQLPRNEVMPSDQRRHSAHGLGEHFLCPGSSKRVLSGDSWDPRRGARVATDRGCGVRRRRAPAPDGEWGRWRSPRSGRRRAYSEPCGPRSRPRRGLEPFSCSLPPFLMAV